MKWLQVHLSTAVVLMFAAGWIIWGNVTPWFKDFMVPGDNRSKGWLSRNFGWPHAAYQENPRFGPIENCRFGLDLSQGPVIEWSYAGIAIDLAVAAAILFAVWFVCERWIAWRAGRKKK